MIPHTDEYAAQIRDQPQAPDQDAEPVETAFGVFRAFGVDPYCPERMDEHQDDRSQSRNGMYLAVHVASRPGERTHQGRPGRVGAQAQDKENDMPPAQAALVPFSPDADGVTQEGQRDGDSGQGQVGERGGSWDHT